VSCGEQALSIADILRDHVGSLHLDHEQDKAVAHILACRTGRLGGHVAFCEGRPAALVSCNALLGGLHAANPCVVY
jgi:hypothetical protein